MFHNLHPWRSKKFSLRENRLAFDGETPDPTKRHEAAINEMEGEKEHVDVQKQVEDFRKAGKDTQDKQKEAVKTAVKSIEGILKMKIGAQLALFMKEDVYKTADDSKKNELLQTRKASLCRDSAARFNSHAKLRGNVHAEVGKDEDGDPMVVLTLVEAAPPAPDQQQQKPADAKTDKSEAKAPEKKTDGTADKKDAKGQPEAKPEDPAKAKERTEAIAKLTKESPAIGKLVTDLGDARSQDVALAALGKMSPDEMNVLTGALQKASKAIDPKKLIEQSQNYLNLLSGPKTQEAAKNMYKLNDKEITTLVKLFGNIEDAKKTVPGAPAEKVDTRPPPKTEGERLTREIEDAVAILKDPTKSNTEKFTAALSALGAVMDMIKNLGDLKGPPKKASATQPGAPGETAKGPSAPSSGSESTSKGPAGSPSGDEALRRKAKKEKGAANLEEYRTSCNKTVQESDGQLLIQRRTLDGRKQQQKDLEKDLADAQKLTGPDGDKKKADIQHQIDLVKADITKIENTIKTIEASAKEARDDLKQMEDMEKRAKSVQQELSNLGQSLTTFINALPNGAATPDQQAFLHFFNYASTSVTQDFEIKLNMAGGGAETFRKMCIAQNIGSQFADLGMHADGEVHDIGKFRNSMMALAQKLFPGAGVPGAAPISTDLPPIPGDRPSSPGTIENFKDVLLTPEKRTELMNKTITHIREFQRRGQKEIEGQIGNNGDTWPERRKKIEKYTQAFEQSVDIIRKEGMNGTREVQSDLVLGASNRLRQAQSETRIDCSDIRQQVDSIYRVFQEGREPPAAAPAPTPDRNRPAEPSKPKEQTESTQQRVEREADEVVKKVESKLKEFTDLLKLEKPDQEKDQKIVKELDEMLFDVDDEVIDVVSQKLEAKHTFDPIYKYKGDDGKDAYLKVALMKKEKAIIAYPVNEKGEALDPDGNEISKAVISEHDGKEYLETYGFEGDPKQGVSQDIQIDTVGGKDGKGTFVAHFRCVEGTWQTRMTPPDAANWIKIDPTTLRMFDVNHPDRTSRSNRNALNNMYDHLGGLNVGVDRDHERAAEPQREEEKFVNEITEQGKAMVEKQIGEFRGLMLSYERNPELANQALQKINETIDGVYLMRTQAGEKVIDWIEKSLLKDQYHAKLPNSDTITSSYVLAFDKDYNLQIQKVEQKTKPVEEKQAPASKPDRPPKEERYRGKPGQQ